MVMVEVAYPEDPADVLPPDLISQHSPRLIDEERLEYRKIPNASVVI